MKCNVICLLLCLLAGLTACAETPTAAMGNFFDTNGLNDVGGLAQSQHVVQYNHVMPQDHLFAREAPELEYQYRVWLTHLTGLSFSIGGCDYDFANDRNVSVSGATTTTTEVNAKVRTIPIGILGNVRIGETKENQFILSGGVKYIIADTKGGVDRTINSGGAITNQHYQIHMDNAWCWEVSLAYERELTKNIRGIVGGGYRYDPGSTALTVNGSTISNKYASWFYRAGLAIRID